MTPNTSDSPEAMRNRNIAVVRPPRNWPNRSDTDTIGQTSPLRAAAQPGRRVMRVTPLGAASVHVLRRVVVLGVLDDRERVLRVLDHLAPELAGLGLMGLRVEGPLAHRRVEGEPLERLGDLVGVRAAGLLDALDQGGDRLVAHDRPARAVLR